MKRGLLAELFVFIVIICAGLYWWTLVNKQQNVTNIVFLGSGREPVFSINGEFILFAYADILRQKQLDHVTNAYNSAQDIPVNISGTFDWLGPDEILYFKFQDGEYTIDSNPRYQLWAYNIQIRKEYPLSKEVFESFLSPDFALSSSKQKIAFPVISPTNNNEGERIHILDLETFDLTKVNTPNGMHCREPEWSLDDSILLYVCDDPEVNAVRNPQSKYVWMTDLITNTPEKLTGITDYRDLSWSPDNKWVAFTHNFSIWLAPVEDGKPNFNRIVYLPLRLGSSPFFPAEDFYFTPPGKVSWSPDGKRLAVGGLLQNTTFYGIWVAELKE